jgi:threonyl-tRNA synthetase
MPDHASSAVPVFLSVMLPDGIAHQIPAEVSARQVVADLVPHLLRSAVALQIDGEVVDLLSPVRRGGALKVLRAGDPEALPVLRHSAAHLLAAAVRRLRPEAQMGFGPAIEDGFYYDFDLSSALSESDFPALESEMAALVADNAPFVREEVSRAEAELVFAGDPLKLERLADLGEDEIISIYRNGDFVDLCRGPHVPSVELLTHVALLSVAGAFWRGDESRPQLQRVYGDAYFRAADLDAALRRRAEARKRDHRVLGRQLDLFSMDPRVGQGLILWHPKGAVIRNAIEEFEKSLLRQHDYDLVYSPHLVNEELLKQSGHLAHFSESMFAPLEIDGVRYRAKPMNCPGHSCIYGSRQRSWRELPVRLAEFGAVYRYERSGALHGMLRVRGFVQDDAHIFCRPDQVEAEVGNLLALVDDMLAPFGYPYAVELASRPASSLGSDAEWAWAEGALSRALDARGVPYRIDAGGGAFYGPKLDFKLVDALGRQWQGPTVQLDFNLPERFDLEYVGPDNQRHRPVMLHRVLVGSMERFVGGLIEHFAGAFPLWLAPEQVHVLPIQDAQHGPAEALMRACKRAGLRAVLASADVDLRDRIKLAEVHKVPYMAVIGAREAEAGAVAVRERGAGRKQRIVPVEEFVEQLRVAHESRARVPA